MFSNMTQNLNFQFSIPKDNPNHTLLQKPKLNSQKSEPFRVFKSFIRMRRWNIVGRVSRPLPAVAWFLGQLHCLARQAALCTLAHAQGGHYAGPGQVDRGRAQRPRQARAGRVPRLHSSREQPPRPAADGRGPVREVRWVRFLKVVDTSERIRK